MVDGFGHFVNAGEPDRVVCDRLGVVAFGWGGVSDALVGSLPVVVEPEPVQQLLKMVDVEGGSFVGKPVFEGAVEPFQFAQGLGVIRRRVDHLHTEVVETLLEHDFCAVESSGETQSVVGEDLAGQPIT